MSGVAAIGFYFARTTLFERIAAGVSALLIIAEFPLSDTSGLVLAAIVTALNFSRARRLAATGPRPAG